MEFKLRKKIHSKLQFLDYVQKGRIGEFIPFVLQSREKRPAPKLIHESGEFVVPACKLTKFDVIALLEKGDSPHEDAEAVVAEYWLPFAWFLGKLGCIVAQDSFMTLKLAYWGVLVAFPNNEPWTELPNG